jgi:hypothetical protein
MRLPLFCLSFATFILFGACKKNSSDNSCELSMSSLSGDYQMISIISKSSNGEVINQFDTAEECVKDNMWTFAPNGYLYIKDIGIQCDPMGFGAETWNLSGNELHFSSGGGGVVKITSFNCDQFSYEGTELYNGVTYVTTVTFKRY